MLNLRERRRATRTPGSRADTEKVSETMAASHKPGDKITKSGIYAVTHEGKHAEAHEATCIAGKTFPSCNECGNDVRFVLVKHARHVSRQDHFRA